MEYSIIGHPSQGTIHQLSHMSRRLSLNAEDNIAYPQAQMLISLEKKAFGPFGVLPRRPTFAVVRSFRETRPPLDP